MIYEQNYNNNNRQRLYQEKNRNFRAEEYNKLKNLPRVGAIVEIEGNEGVVENVEILKEQLKVKIKDGDGFLYKKC